MTETQDKAAEIITIIMKEIKKVMTYKTSSTLHFGDAVITIQTAEDYENEQKQLGRK